MANDPKKKKVLKVSRQFPNPDYVGVQDSDQGPKIPSVQTQPLGEEDSEIREPSDIILGAPQFQTAQPVAPKLDTEPPETERISGGAEPTLVDNTKPAMSESLGFPTTIAPPSPGGAPALSVPSIKPVVGQDVNELQRLTSTGSGVSQHHGVLGGILKGLDVAGSVLAPGIAASIPGTTAHHNELIAQTRGHLAKDISEQQEQARARDWEAQAQERENPEAKPDIEAYQFYRQAGLDPAAARQRTLQDAQDTKAQADVKPDLEAYNFYRQGGMTPAQARVQVMKDAQEAKPAQAETQAVTLMIAGKPHTVLVNKGTGQTIKDLGETKDQTGPQTLMVVPGPNGNQVVAAKPGMNLPAGAMSTTQMGGQGEKFDKDYVVPARGVEQSYQMMDQAYKEYKDARAQGKELPTGAQSMLALSTHLSTTFGNVKGSRVTKDMIAEHLGARGLTDSATVAIQRLTNGDQLSPAQWEAFHDLIRQSRDLKWKQATDEAKRKNLPVDFLPNDLGGSTGAAPSGTGGITIHRDAQGRIVGIQ